MTLVEIWSQQHQKSMILLYGATTAILFDDFGSPPCWMVP